MTSPSRSEGALLSPERDLLEAFLDDHRDAIVEGLAGLDEDQARRRLVPSLTSPMSLVKHAAFVEKVWFQVSLAGRARSEVGVPDEVDDSFEVTEQDTVASVVADFVEACAESRVIAASHDLDDVALHNRRGPISLRWIYVHVIRELAQHCGHADILREQIEAEDR